MDVKGTGQYAAIGWLSCPMTLKSCGNTDTRPHDFSHKGKGDIIIDDRKGRGPVAQSPKTARAIFGAAFFVHGIVEKPVRTRRDSRFAQCPCKAPPPMVLRVADFIVAGSAAVAAAADTAIAAGNPRHTNPDMPVALLQQKAGRPVSVVFAVKNHLIAPKRRGRVVTYHQTARFLERFQFAEHGGMDALGRAQNGAGPLTAQLAHLRGLIFAAGQPIAYFGRGSHQRFAPDFGFLTGKGIWQAPARINGDVQSVGGKCPLNKEDFFGRQAHVQHAGK